MLGASLLLHGGIIGIAGMWSPPEPADHTVIIDVIDEVQGSNPPPQTTQVEAPVPSTPTPPLDEVRVPTPPIVEKDPLMYEPARTPEPRKPVVSRPLTTLRVNRPSVPSAGSGTTTNISSNASGALPGAGSAANANAWMFPHPPYPSYLLGKHITGSATIRITTDASGQVSNVVIVKSTGSSPLDSYTETYVRSHWHGPANSSRTTEFVYQVR